MLDIFGAAKEPGGPRAMTAGPFEWEDAINKTSREMKAKFKAEVKARLFPTDVSADAQRMKAKQLLKEGK
jgi:hypothetical protein